MAKKEDNDTFDQTEKELKHLIEKAHNENSALNKILKVLNTEEGQMDDSEPSEKEIKEMSKKNIPSNN